MAVNPTPNGYHTITPYLVVENVSGLIEFTKQALGAEEIERLHRDDGGIIHAEVRVGDSVIMMGEAKDATQTKPAFLYVYLKDADAAYQKALEAGAVSLQEPQDQFYGDRTAVVKDEFGNQWEFAARIEDVPEDEMQRRATAQASQN